MTHNEGTSDGVTQTTFYMAPPSGTPERDPQIPDVHERRVSVPGFREREQQDPHFKKRDDSNHAVPNWLLDMFLTEIE